MVKLCEIEVQWVNKTHQLADPLKKYRVWTSSSMPNRCSEVWKTLRWNHNEDLYIELNFYVDFMKKRLHQPG